MFEFSVYNFVETQERENISLQRINVSIKNTRSLFIIYRFPLRKYLSEFGTPIPM